MSAKVFDEAPLPRSIESETAFGCPRNFLGNRFVYVVVSARARGLAIGLNLNPDKFCNFDCVYCEVNPDTHAEEGELDVNVMMAELERTLLLIRTGGIKQVPGYGSLNPELLRLRHVALSGDGEPTLSRKFAQTTQEVVHMRARLLHPFFKLVLITNGTCLDSRQVQTGLQYFTREDEIWIKLDAGTQAYMDRVNRCGVSLAKVMDNALLVGKKRAIVIQSLFPMIADCEPPEEEITQYVERLKELKAGGANISLVQVYSATRPPAHPDCRHLPLQTLARICRRVRAEAGLNAEFF